MPSTRRPTRPAARRRVAAPPPSRRPRRNAPAAASAWPFPLEPSIGVGVAWAFVLLLWATGVITRFSLAVFCMAAVLAIAFTAVAGAEMARGEGLRGARKCVLLAMILTIPVGFDWTSIDVFNIVKFSLLICLGLVLAALWVVDAVRMGRPLRARSGLQWPLLLLVAWSVLATLFSINVRVSLLGAYKSYDGLLSLLVFALLFVSAVEAFRPGDMRRVLEVFVFGAGGLVALYGLFQLKDRLTTTGGHWDWVTWPRLPWDAYIWSTFGNPNHLGGFLAIAIPAGVAVCVLQRSRGTRVFAGLLVAVMLAELVQTSARGAWLGGVLSLVVVALLLAPELKARPKLLLGGGAAAIVLVVGAAVVVDAAGKLDFQFKSLTNFGSNSTAGLRVRLWKEAVVMAGDKPVFGYGPDTFSMEFPRYQDRDWVRLFGPDLVANGPHNTFLNTLATTGWVGLLAFVGLIAFAALRTIGAWRRLRRREREDPDGGGDADDDASPHTQRVLLAGAAGATVGYLVQASFNVQQVGLTACFWFALAAIAVVAAGAGVPDTLSPRRILASDDGADRLEPATEESAPAPLPPSRRPRDRRRPVRAPLPVGAIVTGIVSLVVVIVLLLPATGPWRADRAYWKGLGAENTALSNNDPVAAGFAVDRALNHFDDAAAANPWESTYLETRALFGVQVADAQLRQIANQAPDPGKALQRLRRSRDDLEKAIELQPRSANLHAEYAIVLLRIQDIAKEDPAPGREAIRQLRKSIALNPWLPRPPTLLGTVLARDKHYKEALDVLETARTYQQYDVNIITTTAAVLDKTGDTAKAAELRSLAEDLSGQTRGGSEVPNGSTATGNATVSAGG